MDRLIPLGAAAAAAPVALAAPALAQTAMPEIRWRAQSSPPRVFDVLYGQLERISARVAQLADNKFRDEKVAALHLATVGATLTKLTPPQAGYIGVPEQRPFKAAQYRY